MSSTRGGRAAPPAAGSRVVRPDVSSPAGLDLEASPSQLQTKAYVRQFQVIDNQNLLFELSYKLEASSQ